MADVAPEQRPSKIERWGRRAGGFKHPTWGRIIKMKRGGTGSTSNSQTPGKRWRQGEYGQPVHKKVREARNVGPRRTIDGKPLDRPELS